MTPNFGSPSCFFTNELLAQWYHNFHLLQVSDRERTMSFGRTDRFDIERHHRQRRSSSRGYCSKLPNLHRWCRSQEQGYHRSGILLSHQPTQTMVMYSLARCQCLPKIMKKMRDESCTKALARCRSARESLFGVESCICEHELLRPVRCLHWP